MAHPKSVATTCSAIGVMLLAMLGVACGPNDAEQNAPPPPVMTIDTVTGAPTKMPNPWKNAGCDLVTDAEVVNLFQVDIKRDAFNARSLPDRGFCLRYWMKPDWKEIESANEKPGAVYREFKNTLVTQVLDYGREFVARQQFDMLRNDQRATYEQDVTGLGDDALWSTSTTSLMVKKGHLLVKITLDYTEKPQENLAPAKKVAERALWKMR
ncbi:MAG: hypothetical protein IPM98_07690 [Lewinellaceae bacterium]|nr:hypothetical protein [Lewinellaceae bacterium]